MFLGFLSMEMCAKISQKNPPLFCVNFTRTTRSTTSGKSGFLTYVIFPIRFASCLKMSDLEFVVKVAEGKSLLIRSAKASDFEVRKNAKQNSLETLATLFCSWFRPFWQLAKASTTAWIIYLRSTRSGFQVTENSRKSLRFNAKKYDFRECIQSQEKAKFRGHSSKWKQGRGAFGRIQVKRKPASTGNRTRVNCLEGSYANHYTIDALIQTCLFRSLYFINGGQMCVDSAFRVALAFRGHGFGTAFTNWQKAYLRRLNPQVKILFNHKRLLCK